ncbi:MAG: hypothetical protein ABI586_00495 [Candidatus Nanopelagicales bacterium]
MVEARGVLIVTIVAVLSLLALLLTVASQHSLQPWPGQSCSSDHPDPTPSASCPNAT